MNQPGRGSMPCMKNSDPRRRCLRASSAAGRRGALDGQEDAVERLDAGVEAAAERPEVRLVGRGVAGIGHHHEAVVGRAA